jgi:hypothetical protein
MLVSYFVFIDFYLSLRRKSRDLVKGGDVESPIFIPQNGCKKSNNFN